MGIRDDLELLIERFHPTIYYGVLSIVERNKVLVFGDTSVWIVLHPDDVEQVKAALPEYHLVPIQQAPPTFLESVFPPRPEPLLELDDATKRLLERPFRMIRP